MWSEVRPLTGTGWRSVVVVAAAVASLFGTGAPRTSSAVAAAWGSLRWPSSLPRAQSSWPVLPQKQFAHQWGSCDTNYQVSTVLDENEIN